MLRGYFDDSGTHRGSPVVVMAGVLADESQWGQFEKAWIAKLRNPLEGKSPLRNFHLADCRAGQDAFLGYSPAERDAVTHDFRSIIIDSKLVSIATIIDRVAWDQLVVGQARRAWGSAETQCFIHCISRAHEWAVLQRDPRLNLIFDEGRRSRALVKTADQYEANYWGRPESVSISFAGVSESPALQAADIVATESYWYGQQWLRNGRITKARPHFQHYIENISCLGEILDTHTIENNLNEFRTPQ